MNKDHQKSLDTCCQNLYKQETKYFDIVKKIKDTTPKIKNYKTNKSKKIDHAFDNILSFHEEAREVVQQKIKYATEGLDTIKILIKEYVQKELITELPKWEGSGNPPPLCGKIPPQNNYLASNGDIVAASIPDENTGSSIILCHVKTYSKKNQEYKLVDFFEDLNKGASYYTLPKEDVIPLPRTLSKKHLSQTEFSKDEKVLAVYPETTTFYPAIVLESPGSRSKKGTSTFYYSLRFVNDFVEQIEVYARFVIPIQN
ncbi:hypothetical protein M0813_02457 [Anaeramoeba flamelloides]|uniref:SGF29 C-terminal domain-containing protein n=1 Tax=Anaeramoeba flamelloides TaxID=1746091 RepID=A0ABQ8YDI0_9EUKA|nr:hypothetical protein M0813_02457 [Anaeramoeba flamelloides]